MKILRCAPIAISGKITAMHTSRLRKALLIAAGSLSVALGVLGIFLPLLPTTVFFLMAAACFMRSSDRLYNWLINHRWFGSYIRNYREHRAMTLEAKISILASLWITMLLTMIFALNNGWLRALLAAIGVGVTLHVLKLKTFPRGFKSVLPKNELENEAD